MVPTEAPEAPRRVAEVDLLTRYLGDRYDVLYDDAARRQQHYTPEQHVALAELRRGAAVPASTRAELLLTYARRTEAAALERDTRRRVTAETTRPGKAPPPFESQGEFAGAIRII